MDEIYTTLAHPKRRTILLDLFYEGEGTITHFKQEFNMKTGTLYHHLNILKKHGLVEQNHQRSYKLTTKGIEFIEPLFNEKKIDYPRIKNEVHYSLINSNLDNKNKIKFPFKNSTFYKITDKVLSILFLKSKTVFIINIFLFIVIVFSLSFLKLGLVGNHFFESNNGFLSIFSAIGTLLITILLLKIYPWLLKKEEPVNIEFIMLGMCIFIPIFISTSILSCLTIINQEHLITSFFVACIEFITQVFWLFWVYVIFRRINGLDYIKALLGSFIINYIWSSLILFIY